MFHNPHRKVRPFPLAVVHALEYIVGVHSKAALSEREKKQVRIHTQTTREYLECGNQVCPISSPLQGMKTHQTNAHYQPCSLSLNWLTSARRFGRQAGISYSRCGCTKALFNGMKSDFDRFWKECLILQINCLA